MTDFKALLLSLFGRKIAKKNFLKEIYTKRREKGDEKKRK